MKVAFAVWDDRIAPVFDVARHVHLVETDSGRIVEEGEKDLPEDAAAQRARRLADLGVGTLVCGAISRPVQDAVAAFGIRVVPFVAGDLRDVVRAWLAGGLDRSAFRMPGCGARGGRRLRRRRSGRGGGGPAPATGGDCVCPRCGHGEPHERGVPCSQVTCPKCAARMARK